LYLKKILEALFPLKFVALYVDDVYTDGMVILETPVFTAQITDLITDDSYASLQHELRVNPDAGDVIPQGGGLRKIRWRSEGGGKRGGIRVIYYWYVPGDLIYMLLAYAKNKQSDLTPKQLKILRALVEEEFK